jgi:tRNA U34 2-thiouridine synthase MnmA/TrmU
VQCAAHGTPHAASVEAEHRNAADRVVIRFAEPQRRVAPGQSVVVYRAGLVEGGGIAT